MVFTLLKGNAQTNTCEAIVSVPEPLMFDLVRGLRAR
jgi:hypothetical protein